MLSTLFRLRLWYNNHPLIPCQSSAKPLTPGRNLEPTYKQVAYSNLLSTFSCDKKLCWTLFFLTIGGMNVSSRTIRLKPSSGSDNGKGNFVFLLPLLSFSIDEQLGRALLFFALLKVSVCMIYTLTVFFHFSYANTEFVDHRIAKTRTGEVVSLF